MKAVGIWAKAQIFYLLLGTLAVLLGSAPALAGSAAAPLSPAEVLDRPAMTLSPADLQRTAMALPTPDGEGSVTVARQIRFTFDAQGRATASWHGLIRVLTSTGARSFGPLETEWSPWHEERPKIRARVISRDGRIYLIDERTINEQPAYIADTETHSDRRALRVPLPALQAGAVVEYEIVTVEKKPLFEQGVVTRQFFTTTSPTGLIRLILEAPRSLPLRYVVHGLTPPRQSQNAAGTRLVFERGELFRKDSDDRMPPGTAPLPPQVVFSTGASWAHIARAYGAAVDERLSEGSLVSLAHQIVGVPPNRQAAVQRLLRYLRSEVRYTAVELGESAMLPQPPSETLRRKFGDCKDQATLLVGLLRALGMPAYVALLRTGVSTDVERNLPGLGLFNHAIVYMPPSSDRGWTGGPAMWIDPTLEYAQPDGLSFTEQRRLALIASPTTTALLLTPAKNAMDNRILETREVYLAEYGPSRIIETTEAWGSAERTLREQAKELIDEKNLEKHFAKYAERAYLSEGEVRVQASPPEALETPYRLRVEAARASRGYSALTNAEVAISLRDFLERLPNEILESPEEVDRPPHQARHDVRPYRFEPLVHEWRYRIVPPPGFQAAPLPKSEIVPLGQARLSKSFSIDSDGVITAQLRLDSGSGILTAAEFDAMRRAVAPLREDDMLKVRFDQIGEAHLAAGRFREAFSEFRRLASLHPKEALHLAQLAHALSQGGLGESARQLAADAVSLDPQSAVAHRLHGTVLMHDLSGNFLAPGWDRAGALAALRRAVSLYPDYALARRHLALCLERNTAATVYGPGADLSSAIAEWRTLVKQQEDPSDHESLFAALLHAGRNGELDGAVRAMPKGDVRDAALVVSVALTRGAAAALESARSQISSRADLRAALTKAANTLIALRNYPLAAVLLDEAAVGAVNGNKLHGQAALLRRLRRHEESATLSRPTDFMYQYFVRVFLDDTLGAPHLRALWSPQMVSLLNGEEFEKARHELRADLPDDYPGPNYRADLMMTFVEASAQGNERVGFKVEAASRTGKGFSMYVAKQAGHLRIIGQNGFLQSLGYEALRRVDRGDLAAAQQLLSWAQTSMDSDEQGSPLTFEPFTLLFTPAEPPEASKLRIAAAALSCSLRTEPACPEPYRSRALTILTEARDRSGGERYHELALATLFERIGRFGDALAAVARLRTRGLTSPASDTLEVLALQRSEQSELARARLASILQGAPQSGSAWRLLGGVSQDIGDFVTAEMSWRRLKGLGAPDSLVLPRLGWLAILNGSVTEEAESGARKAVELTKNKDTHTLRILAAVLLERGKLPEALQTLHLISALNEGEQAPADHYLAGRLAEHYSERAAALAAYSHVPAEAGEERKIGTWRWLAQKRLTALSRLAARP